MGSLPMTVFNAETSNKCAEALENENCTVWLPENVKPITAAKAAAKGRESKYNMVYMY